MWAVVDHRYVIGSRSSRVGRVGRLLRDKGRRTPVRESEAMECAAAEDGIRINTVIPGSSTRRFWTKLPVSDGSNGPIDPNEPAKIGPNFAYSSTLRRLST